MNWRRMTEQRIREKEKAFQGNSDANPTGS